MTTCRVQGQNTLRKASGVIANAAALSGLQKGRSSGKKCRTGSVVVFSLCRGRQGINPMLLSDNADAVARGGYGGGGGNRPENPRKERRRGKPAHDSASSLPPSTAREPPSPATP